MLLYFKMNSLVKPRAVLYELENTLGGVTIPEKRKMTVIVDSDISFHTEESKTECPCTYARTDTRGAWAVTTPYSQGDIMQYNGKYYYLTNGELRLSKKLPDSDPVWREITEDTVIVTVPDKAPEHWALKGFLGFPVFGELAVYGNNEVPDIRHTVKFS